MQEPGGQGNCSQTSSTIYWPQDLGQLWAPAPHLYLPCPRRINKITQIKLTVDLLNQELQSGLSTLLALSHLICKTLPAGKVFISISTYRGGASGILSNLLLLQLKPLGHSENCRKWQQPVTWAQPERWQHYFTLSGAWRGTEPLASDGKCKGANANWVGFETSEPPRPGKRLRWWPAPRFTDKKGPWEGQHFIPLIYRFLFSNTLRGKAKDCWGKHTIH